MAARPTQNRLITRTQVEGYDSTKDNAQDFTEDGVTLNSHADDIEANAAALVNKVDKITGKGLSTEDYTTAEKSKVTNLPADTVTSLAAKADAATVATSLSGKADLVGGLVPENQLPSYVDDVEEYADLASFPATGEDGKIYLAIDSGITYRWSGSTYAALNSGLALGETSTTAYRGDRGKTAYDHSQVTHDKTLVGLANVDNTSDANKPVSTATQAALNLKLNTSSFTAAGIGLGNVENKSSATIRGEIVEGDIPVEIARVTAIPINLSDLTADSTHRTVTDAEKAVWNASGGITGGVAETQATTLDFSTYDVATVSLTSNLAITTITGLASGGIGKRLFTLNGYTLSILGTSYINSRDGKVSITVNNWGTSGTPVHEVIDNYSVDSIQAGALSTTPKTITSAEILAMNATPQILKTAPGANIIDWPSRARSYFKSNGVAYITNTVVELLSGSTVIGTCDILGSTSDTAKEFTMSGVPEINAPLSVRVQTGDPAAGNGEFGVIVYYDAIDLTNFTFTNYDITTLGTTAPVQTSTSSTLTRKYTILYPEADGFIDSISVYHNTVSGNITVAVYSDSTLTPSALLGISSSQSANTSGAAFSTHTLNTPVAITKGTPIWIAWVYDAATTTYSRSSWGKSGTGDATYSLPDPAGTFTANTHIYPAHANVRYNPATYNYILNEDFTNWAVVEYPDGWTESGGDANNYAEENANGVRIVSDGTFYALRKSGLLTIGQVYYCEVEIYSLTSTGTIINGSDQVGDARYVGKTSFMFTATGTYFELARYGTGDVIIKSCKIWQ